MRLETRDFLSILALLASVVLGVITARNGRRGVETGQENLKLQKLKHTEDRVTELEGKVAKANGTIESLQRKLRVTTELADQATAEWTALSIFIHRPGMTLDRVKDYVGPPTAEPATGGGRPSK